MNNFCIINSVILNLGQRYFRLLGKTERADAHAVIAAAVNVGLRHLRLSEPAQFGTQVFCRVMFGKRTRLNKIAFFGGYAAGRIVRIIQPQRLNCRILHFLIGVVFFAEAMTGSIFCPVSAAFSSLLSFSISSTRTLAVPLV